jgi:phage shock protein PspC (stress-responsive transcriptional regulator)
MMTNRFVAGVVAGLAISAVGLIYSVVRKDKMVGLFMR